MNPTFCMIAAPRSGTNHLCRVLHNFSDLRSYAEIFNPLGAHGIQARELEVIRRREGIDASTHTDERLIGFAREHPWRILEALHNVASASGKRCISFKVFSDHLDWPKLRDEIVLRDNVHLIFVIRHALDSYISGRKAHVVNSWLHTDTTGVRVEIDAADFATWFEGQRRWYDYWREVVFSADKPCRTITYEDDLTKPPAQILRGFSQAAKALGVDLQVPVEIKNPGLTRQDKSRDYADKVANWSEFMDGLKQRGLSETAFGYAI